MSLFLSTPISLGLALLLLAGTTFAQQNDVAGSADYPGFQRFPGSDISDYRHESSAVYNLALGRMQRVDGRVASSRAERLQGELTRITYAVPAGFTAAEVYEHWRGQLLAAGQTQLFECQGRGCGSSNFWANDMFGNRVLYGPESNQYYIASTFSSQINGQPVSGFAALYAITRANRRVYVHIDFLRMPDEESEAVSATPEAISRRLVQEGSVVLQNLSFDEHDALLDNSGIALLVQILRQDVLLNVYVVGHLRDADEAEVEVLLERSAHRAQQVREALLAEGIEADRVSAHGVGPLAPYCRPLPCNDRIEMVRR